jgi:hypothetical protein
MFRLQTATDFFHQPALTRQIPMHDHHPSHYFNLQISFRCVVETFLSVSFDVSVDPHQMILSSSDLMKFDRNAIFLNNSLDQTLEPFQTEETHVSTLHVA